MQDRSTGPMEEGMSSGDELWRTPSPFESLRLSRASGRSGDSMMRLLFLTQIQKMSNNKKLSRETPPGVEDSALLIHAAGLRAGWRQHEAIENAHSTRVEGSASSIKQNAHLPDLGTRILTVGRVPRQPPTAAAPQSPLERPPRCQCCCTLLSL